MPAETNVNIPALIGQARDWDAQSTVMGTIASEAHSAMPSSLGSALGESALTMAAVPTGLAAVALLLGDYPLFQPAIDAYLTASGQLGALAEQGQHQMSSMASALITAAKRYQANEDGIAQASGNALH